MKRYLLTLALLFVMGAAFTQPGKKPTTKEKPPQSEMDKSMEEAMKGMSEEEKTEMKKMMKEIMPDIVDKPGSDAAPFTDNKKLVPIKDLTRINSITKKAFTDADVNTNTTLLYNKLMTKIPVAEKAIVTKVLTEAKDAPSLMAAAITAWLQGHNQAAMGLAMKAVQADPKNMNNQNNLAAILSQSGYPEKAIPYLKKLSHQFPGNSTVLNNLGYAWLSLGEVDTARRYFGYAAMSNPANPETKLCRGVIEELKGDPKKAADNYIESFEELPNPFTENLAKNVKAQDRLEKIDFDKLKSRITIYEYFKKDWIKIPALSDDVSHYENDMKLKNGFSKMFEELSAKIEQAKEASSAEIDALIAKGETTFVKEMAKESVKGLSMMSMPAVYVQKILMAYIKKWFEDYVRTYAALKDDISAKMQVMTKTGKNDKCPDFDRKNNEFMAYANPLIRNYQAKKIEELRTWLNAFCTWSWYIAGNPKNSIMTQCIGWTNSITDMYKTAINDQYAFPKSCVKQDGDGLTNITAPAIPNFSCPPVVSIPIGLDEIRLSAEAVNFDDNTWKIEHAPGTRIPNQTLTFGADKNHIAEPGKYGNPYVKTGNGSANTSGINYADSDGDKLTPLSKILEDLTPLPRIPLDELAPLDPSLLNPKKLTAMDANKIRQAELARKILKDMLSTKCPGELPVKKPRKPRFEVGMGELVLEPGFEVGMGELVLEPGFEVGLGQLELWDEEVQGWVDVNGVIQLPPIDLGELGKTGLQPVINNGLDIVGTIKNFIKGLFD